MSWLNCKPQKINGSEGHVKINKVEAKRQMITICNLKNANATAGGQEQDQCLANEPTEAKATED